MGIFKEEPILWYVDGDFRCPAEYLITVLKLGVEAVTEIFEAQFLADVWGMEEYLFDNGYIGRFKELFVREEGKEFLQELLNTFPHKSQ